MIIWGLLASAVAVGFAAAGPTDVAPTPSSADYVSLGSSFAAGPDVGRPDPDGPKPCRRSLDNYAHKLAARRSLSLVDRTCSGAKAADLVSHRQFGLPPQIDAINPTTRLVTITVGGNDVSYLGDLSAASCRNLGNADCQTSPSETLDARFAALHEAMTSLLMAVRSRAPTAVIAVVDYVTIVTRARGCPDRAPLTDADLAWATAREARLRQLTAEVAAANGALLIKASDLTARHDVCAPEPWVYGWREPDPSGRPLASYHPRIEAMEAIAAELDRQLPKSIASPN